MVTSIIVALFYLVVVAYLGYKGWRETATSTDYMVAGRKIHPYVMAMSYGATFISTSAIIGFGGAAALFGFGLIWLTFCNIFIGIWIAFIFFGIRTRRMGRNLDAHTFPELLARRYDSRFLQWFVALIIFVFLPAYAAAVLIGIARFVQVYFHINYDVALFVMAIIVAVYVIWGGLKGVMYTDAFQATVMFIVMVIFVIVTYYKVGGIIDGHRALSEMRNLIPPKLQKLGLWSWTAFPKGGSPFWYLLVTTVILGVGIGVLAQPQLAVRFMTVGSDAAIYRGVVFGGIFILAMTGIAFTVGPLTNVVFYHKFHKISVAMAKGNIDKIIPIYITKCFPHWYATLFLLGMLAAAMSTLSSQFHVIGTSLGRDFYEKGLMGLEVPDARSVYLTRVGIAIGILATVVCSYIFPPGIIAIATAFFFGLCGGVLIPAFLLGLYWRRMNKPAAVASVVIGFIVSMFWLLFVQKLKGKIFLGGMLFGMKKPLFSYPWFMVDAQLITLPITFFVAIVVALLTSPMDKKHLDRCFKGI